MTGTPAAFLDRVRLRTFSIPIIYMLFVTILENANSPRRRIIEHKSVILCIGPLRVISKRLTVSANRKKQQVQLGRACYL